MNCDSYRTTLFTCLALSTFYKDLLHHLSVKKTAVDCIHNTNNFLFADGKLRKVKPGDCMVAFSQRDLYQLRREIEKKSKEKCAIIYGSLPPGKASTL